MHVIYSIAQQKPGIKRTLCKMRRIRKSQSAIIPSIILYLDDVEEILALLKEKSEDVNISDRDFTYESLGSLIKNTGPYPKALAFKIRAPYVSLNFDRREPITFSYLYAADDEEAEGLFLRLRELLLRRQLWINHFVRVDIAAVLTLIALIFDIIPTPPLLQFLGSPSLGIIGTFVFLYVLLAIFLRLGALYSIRLVKRHESQSFLKKNISKLVLIVLGAVVAEIIRWVATMLER